MYLRQPWYSMTLADDEGDDVNDEEDDVDDDEGDDDEGDDYLHPGKSLFRSRHYRNGTLSR